MRALQEKICHFTTGSDETILNVLSLNPDRYILLMFNRNAEHWIMMNKTDGEEKGRLQLKHLIPREDIGSRRGAVSLFTLSDRSFGVLAGEDIVLWDSFRSMPRRMKLKFRSADDRLFFRSNPVAFVRSMDDGSLVLAHRTVFSEAYFFTIATLGPEGYSFSRSAVSLDSRDFRHLFYIASVPCIMDILPGADRLFVHTPGSYRNWEQYSAEGSILIQMNRQGGIISSRSLYPGRGVFSADGETLLIKPFESDSDLYFYSLTAERSRHLVLDEHAQWTPGTADTRYIVSHGKIAAWNRDSFILSNFYNMPEWQAENAPAALAVC